jgi:hypothetical protein
MKPKTIFPVVGIFVVSLCTIASAMPIHVSERDLPGGCRGSVCDLPTELSVNCPGSACDLPSKREKRVTLCKMGDCDMPSEPEKRSPDNCPRGFGGIGDECDEGAEHKGTFEREKRLVSCPMGAGGCDSPAKPEKRTTVRYRPGNNELASRSVDNGNGNVLDEFKPEKRYDDTDNDGVDDEIKIKGVASEKSVDDWNAPGNNPESSSDDWNAPGNNPESSSDDWNSPGKEKRTESCPGSVCDLPRKPEKRVTACPGSDCDVDPKPKDIGKHFPIESMY